MFVNSGFTHVPTRDLNFVFEGHAGEIDGLYFYENIVVILEETTSASALVADHLRKKVELFEHFESYCDEVMVFLGGTFSKVEEYFEKHPSIDPRECILKYVYCSRFDIDETHRTRYEQHCSILQYAAIQYFLRLSKTIRRSARFELLKFLGLDLTHIVGPERSESHSYRALLLPEVPSGFPAGYKLVSFLIDPSTLIERAYVLRADSWRDHEAVYQRLLVKGKITSMRKYLTDEKRVFVNNIIVTLPSNTTFSIEPAARPGRAASQIASGLLTIPRAFNTIGIINGQHRVFAYHEGSDVHESAISVMRDRQHLLVTGIIYPEALAESRAREFEAKLFLEINDKQKRVRGDLKQSIERIVNPYSAVAVAKSVIERLAATGPLAGMLEVHFFDVGKIKTTSIVNYGLRHIVAIGAEVSLFNRWDDPARESVLDHASESSLNTYVNWASTQLNLLVAGFKSSVAAEFWVTDRKASRALSATTVNGLVFCMRRLIETNKLGNTYEYYRNAFTRLRMDFRPNKFPFKSSHWRDLGNALFDQCFK